MSAQTIPYALLARRFYVVVACLVCASACTESAASSVESQRRVSEARIEPGIEASITYGAFRRVRGIELEARAATPTPRITVRTPAGIDAELDLTVGNLVPDSELRTVGVTKLTSREEEGCPADGGSIACSDDGGDPLCAPPDAARLAEDATTVRARLNVPECTNIQFRFVSTRQPEAPLEFLVVGGTRDLETFDDIAAQTDDDDVEFVVLLGDNLADRNTDGVDALERKLEVFDAPVIALPGGEETRVEDGVYFLRRFGPHDFIWTIAGVRFFAFYTAGGGLGERGLSRLNTFLVELERQGRRIGGGPLIGLTHVPPLDPVGLRGQGFDSDLEAARTLSILQRYDVDYLFAGSVGSSGYEDLEGLEVILTSAAGSVVTSAREYLFVRVADGEVTIERRQLR